MSIFDAGRALAGAAFAWAGEPVEYWRAGARVAACLAKPAKTVFSAEARYAAVNLRFAQRDFIFRAADLPAAPWEPQGGDVVKWAGAEWIVAAPIGEPVWREHAPGALRIHAKRATPPGAA